jgi:hypothetical protein
MRLDRMPGRARWANAKFGDRENRTVTPPAVRHGRVPLIRANNLPHRLQLDHRGIPTRLDYRSDAPSHDAIHFRLMKGREHWSNKPFRVARLAQLAVLRGSTCR